MHHIVNDIMKENAPRISVIVPIYNVEPYVRQCLDSLKNQTMKEIEIICIDDGSTDRSGEIADEYASATSPVFRVIHTENRGLSAARNRGIEESRAPWIMFVDSDDWVDESFCEIPYNTAIKNDADLVIFDSCRTTESGRVKRNNKNIKNGGLICPEAVVDMGVSSWNKLYKKELFQGIRYPEGRVCEDVGTIHKVVYKASRIIRLYEVLYYYRFRKDSICHSVSFEKDRLDMYMLRCNDLISLGYPENKARAKVYGAALRSCGRASRNDYIEAELVLKNLNGIPSEFSKTEKLMMIIWKLNKRLYRLVYKFFLQLQIWVET